MPGRFTGDDSEGVGLTKLERLLLANQLRILHHFKDERGSLRAAQALEEGYELHFDDAFQGIWDTLPIAECRFVLDVLEMHRMMRFAVDESNSAMSDLSEEIRFRGFDGNNETEYLCYTNFYMSEPGVYDELKDEKNTKQFGWSFNSHMPMREVYLRMIRAWEASSDQYRLTREDIERILESRRYPR